MQLFDFFLGWWVTTLARRTPALFFDMCKEVRKRGPYLFGLWVRYTNLSVFT